MFVELHILQNFAPSNLNRDDTGAPKDCEFGGYRRARISSQCLKRAVRMDFKRNLAGTFSKDSLADRSKGLRDEVAKHLVTLGRPEGEARKVVSAAFGALRILFQDDDKSENKSEYLVFAGPAELRRFADICQGEWDTLRAVYDKAAQKVWESKKPSKDEAMKAVSKAVKDKLAAALDGGKAVDLALFGRMLADLPDKNIDATCQVAHAISTHKVSMEFDYYTAVDDLKPEETAGADMIGTVEFNSACFYRYANVDLGQLKKNLGNDDDAEDLARKTVEAFLRASVAAVPTGKQNSMAAQNPPSAVFAVVRSSGLWSLANAFARPVPNQSGDLVQKSLFAMDDYWGKLTTMYGPGGIEGKWLCALEGDGVVNLKSAEVASVNCLVKNVLGTIKFDQAKAGAK